MASAQAQLTFTPRAAGKIILLVDFDGQVQTGSDWAIGGSYVIAKPFLTQNSVTTYGQQQAMGTARLKYSVQGVFSVVSGLSVTCGLELVASGVSAGVAIGINIRAHLVKETSF